MMETLQESFLMERTWKLKKECQECGIYDNASYANKGGCTSVCYLALLLYKRDWLSFISKDMTSVSPLPHHQFPERALLSSTQAKCRATNLEQK